MHVKHCTDHKRENGGVVGKHVAVCVTVVYPYFHRISNHLDNKVKDEENDTGSHEEQNQWQNFIVFPHHPFDFDGHSRHRHRQD